MFTAGELEEFITREWPDGLTPHGWDYLVHLQPNGSGPDGLTYVPKDWQTEILFEAVRRADFPGRPTRLKSYFAFQTLPEAQGFRSGHMSIFELDCADAFLADWVWLSVGQQGAAGLFNAQRYWSGTASAKPKWEIVMPAPVRVLGLAQR